MRRIVLHASFAILIVSHILILRGVDRARTFQENRENPFYVPPSAVLKIVSLDFDGLVSDFLFIEGSVYIGREAETARGRRAMALSESQWLWFYRIMDAVSDLDPYFQDPYYSANAFLTWDAGMVHEADALLDKGSRHRTWDWKLPFFIGFNEFYFLHDNENAGLHLMEASRRPNASPMLASIAARLAFKGRRIETAILFLEDILSRTDDEGLRQAYGVRLRALKNLDLLEQASNSYRKKTGRDPQTVEDLVRRGVIETLPDDPYGGRYYLEQDGLVRSTTDKNLGVFDHELRPEKQKDH